MANAAPTIPKKAKPGDTEAMMQEMQSRNAPTRYTPPAANPTPEQIGAKYAETQARLSDGAASVAPKAPPAPQLPDQARFGVLKRNGIDPATGKEYGFVGVGANGQGSGTFNTYEGAREFSQNQRAQPQQMTPAVAATETSPAISANPVGPAPTSLPYVTPSAPRGFSQNGMRDEVPVITRTPTLPAPATTTSAAPAPVALPAPQVGDPLPSAKDINAAATSAPVLPPTVNRPNINGAPFSRPVPVPPPTPTPVSAPQPAATPVNQPFNIYKVDPIGDTVSAVKGDISTGRQKQTAREGAGRANARPNASPTYLMGGPAKRTKPARKSDALPPIDSRPATNPNAPTVPQMFAPRTPPFPSIMPTGSNRPSAFLA